MENGEFKELYVKEGSSKELLKKTLSGNIKLTETGDVLLTSIKPAKRAIVMYLLGNKVLKLDGVKQEEAEGPAEIFQRTGIPRGTVGRELKELSDDGFVKTTEDGKYFIPDNLLLRIHELFENKGDKNEN